LNNQSILFQETHDELHIQNRFVSIIVDLIEGNIHTLKADFSGKADFYSKDNLLAKPYSLEVKYSDTSTNGLRTRTNLVSYKIQEKTDNYIKLKLFGIHERIMALQALPVFTESWELTLHEEDRYFGLSIEGEILQDSSSIIYASHTMYTHSESIYGFFDRGVAQMMGNSQTCMGANDHLQRGIIFY
jgi:hypothetical protein